MEELCCKKTTINAFEQPLQQGFFNQKDKVAGHAAQAWQSSRGWFLLSLAVTPLSKENWLAASKYIWIFCEKPAPRCCRLSNLIQYGGQYYCGC
jgi:hypothetical protein